MTCWMLSHSCHPMPRRIADRHYSRQKPGTPRFVPPGRCLTLTLPTGDAVWATSWPFPEHTKHEWAGAWICSIFRNESPNLSSDLIREAVAITRWYWPDEVPDLGMVTFVDPRKVKSTNPGFCFLKAGFQRVGHTQGGLIALQLLHDEMPSAIAPLGAQMPLAMVAG